MIWLKLRMLELILKRKNLFMYINMKINANSVYLCALFVIVPFCLDEKSKKNVFKNLTKMLMCFCCGDVAE